MKGHNCHKLFGLYMKEISNTVTMNYIGRSFKFNRIVYRKYTKKYKFNIKILTFLKSNYKYKRRCLRKNLTDKMLVQRNTSHRRQIRNNNQMEKEKHQLPVEEDMLKNNKNIIQKIPIYDNTKLDKFLKIFILIMQQAQLTATTINDERRKNASNGLARRLVAKTKAIKNTNRSSLTSNVNEDEINRNHRAYKDANNDTDNNIDIDSNIVDEISHQQHNYDKVSTITSTPIKCQRRKHFQLNATKTSATILSTSASLPSAPLASPATMNTSLSSPSVVVQTYYETYQWSAILRNCACDSPPIHHQYPYHHYHHKRKHIQHHHFYQQHQQQQQQQQQHTVHIKSLTSRSLLSDNNNNNNNNNNNKSDSSSIKNNNRSHNSNTIDSRTCRHAIAVYQTFDQYVNATWNRSYNISCLLLTLFIAFTIGIRSTTAGACWQTVLDNGKCNEIFSLNISKSECCGANQEFAYTEREPTNVEYFFATAIGGGMECSPCLESCRNVKCGPNKKCVKRKGRPKCICAPECGAARRKRKQREHSTEQEQRGHQHHTEDLFTSISKDVGGVENENDDVSSATVVESSNGFNIKIDKSQQSRDIRSLSSEITNVNLGLKDDKHVMMINSGGATSQMERHHSNNKEHNQNQRKLIHVHMEEHSYSQQQQQKQQKNKKSIDLQQYTHQIQQHQQADQLRLQLEQQQMKRKDQEPKGSRRLLITANVEHTEKPTTRRLQIFSNVRTTHDRRRNSNKNKSNTSKSNSNRNRNKNNNKKKNKSDQHEDTDPSDTDIDDKVVENDEDYNYNDTEDNEDNIETKMIYRNSNSNSNGNSNSNSNNSNKNNINRNDDATRFLNQSLSRHKLTANIRVNNKNSNSNSNSSSKSSDNNSKNNERKIKRRKNHDLQRTEILQHHSSDNNTRIRYPQQNQNDAVNISHHHHNRHHHGQQQQRKHNHHRQDFHNHNHHKKHNQQQNHHRRHHGRQKFNRHQQQQTIEKEEPKNDKDYNATITVVSPIPITITPTTYNTSDTINIAPFTTLLKSQVLNAALATPLMNLSSSSSSSSSVLENSTSVIIVTTTPNQQIQPSRSQLLLSSSAMSSLSAATPVNSTLSALNSEAAAVDAADDFYHSHPQNHGSKIATSSSQSPSSTSSSYSQPSESVSVSVSSESAFLPSVSAKGEGVSRHDHQHRRIQILTSNKHNNNNNNNNNDNDDHKIAALNSNLHNNPQQQEEQKEQQHDQQPQAHQQYFHSTLFDAISDQIDFMGFSTKQQTITDAEFDRPLNPVCGTDGRTYNTECQLRKRACRTDNPNLQIAYRGHCRTTCNGVKCLNGLTCIEDQYSMPHCIACKIECPQDDCDNDVVDATKAVCGADGKTYKSVCDINRMICKIGRSIGVAYPGPCRVEQITCDDINCGPKQVCLIDWLTHTPRCTSCRYKCSRKRRPSFPPFEEGKICGVNNRTYNSWCEMRKDSCSTGFYIDLKYSGDCH